MDANTKAMLLGMMPCRRNFSFLPSYSVSLFTRFALYTEVFMSLKKQLIRLGNDHPELRSDLRAIVSSLKKESISKFKKDLLHKEWERTQKLTPKDRRRLTHLTHDKNGKAALIALINNDQGMYKDIQRLDSKLVDSRKYEEFERSYSKERHEISRYLKKNKRIYERLEDLSKKPLPFIVGSSKIKIRHKRLYKRKWKKFKHDYGIFVDGLYIVEVTGKPKKDQGNATTPRAEALQKLFTITTKSDAADRAEAGLQMISSGKGLTDDLRLQLRTDFYNAGMDNAEDLFIESGEPSTIQEKRADILKSVIHRFEKYRMHRGAVPFREMRDKLRRGEDLTDEEWDQAVAQVEKDFSYLLDDFKGERKGGTIGAEAMQKIELLLKLKQRTNNDWTQDFTESLIKRYRDGREPTERQLDVLADKLRESGMAEKAPEFGRSKEAPEEPVEEPGDQDSNIDPERLEVLNKLEDIAHSRDDDWLKDFIPSIKDQLEKGKELSEKQLKSIRHNLYKNRMKEQADLFRKSSSISRRVARRFLS